MKWLTAFSCYADAAILVKPKRRLDINVEDKSHPVYDTKYNTARAAAAAGLMRYVCHWVVLGFNGSGSSN